MVILGYINKIDLRLKGNLVLLKPCALENDNKLKLLQLRRLRVLLIGHQIKRTANLDEISLCVNVVVNIWLMQLHITTRSPVFCLAILTLKGYILYFKLAPD